MYCTCFGGERLYKHSHAFISFCSQVNRRWITIIIKDNPDVLYLVLAVYVCTRLLFDLVAAFFRVSKALD